MIYKLRSAIKNIYISKKNQKTTKAETNEILNDVDTVAETYTILFLGFYCM